VSLRVAVLLGLLTHLPCARAIAADTPAQDRSVVTRERTVVEIESGVYVIRHKDAPDTNPQGNTTVIVGDRSVLVIDSGYLPSSTREDIAQIRQWTARPVRYLVNTHWHPDHIRGNPLYAAEFPGLTILAHRTTPELQEGYDGPNLVRYRARVTSMEESLKRGKGADGKKLGKEERAAMTLELNRRRAVLEEFASYEPAPPNVTFHDHMSVDLGNRVVELRHLGRGHSSGDIIAYLPRERTLITGDLVASPVPYFFAGYPYDQIATLEALGAMDARVLVPGHGEVMHDEAFLDRTVALMKDVRDQVTQELRRRGSLAAKLEDIRKDIDLRSYETDFAGTDPESIEFFGESMDGLVRLFFEQAPK
jgi:cyclase